MTQQKIQWILQTLSFLGCEQAVVCAGARNAPLAIVLERCQNLKVWHFFEERDASFFALGLMKSSHRPVAVVTTSGTAVAELLPATVEAYYSGLPLVLITADRPPRFRGSGAPQSIEQIGLFSHYVTATFDMVDDTPPLFESLGFLIPRGPLHLNVCLEEPTKEEIVDLESLNWSIPPPPLTACLTKTKLTVSNCYQNINKKSLFAKISDHPQVAKLSQPVVVLGPLPLAQQSQVKNWLQRVQLPFYAESLSGLRQHPEIEPWQIKGGENSLKWALEKGYVQAVLRLGHIPTTRIWRDLEHTFKTIPVVSFSDLPFSGLSRQNAPIFHLSELDDVFSPTLDFSMNSSWNPSSSWWSQDHKASQVLRDLCSQFPTSEPSLCRTLSEQIPPGSRIYIGNSLPIREWDLVAQQNPQWWIQGNRGANGIDGQLSTFLGFTDPTTSSGHWALLGDLTTLYNLSAPWILKERPIQDLKIVVLNNGGGKIFTRLFHRPELENHHSYQFSAWAQMWNLQYRQVKDPYQLKDLPATNTNMVVEIQPDPQATTAFWNEWENFWRK